MKKIAIVTGTRGQDGPILIDQLLQKDYKVYGMIRKTTETGLGNAEYLKNNSNLEIVEGDITDLSELTRLFKLTKPDYIFNNAALSHVGTSFEQPITTANITGIGVLNCLEAIRLNNTNSKFLQFSSIPFDEPLMLFNREKHEIIRTDLNEAEKIWNINKNIEVLTSDNNGKVIFKKIKNVIDHGFKEIYNIELYNGINFKLTGDHSLIVLRNEKLTECKVKDLKENEPILSFCGYKQKIPSFIEIEKEHILNWETQIYHKVGSFEFEKIQTKTYINNVLLDKELAYLMGMYCAEGYSDKYKVSWCFGKHDFDLPRPNQVAFILKSKFKKNKTYRYERKSSTLISVNSKIISNFFHKYIGSNAHNKRIPKEIFTSSLDIQISFLNGYLGDAKIEKNKYKGITYTTVSKELAIDLIWLLKTIGIACRLIKRFNKQHLSPNKKNIKDSYCYDIKISGCSSWLNKYENLNFKQSDNYCLPKMGFNFPVEKNISKRKLIEKNNIFGKSDICLQKIKNIVKQEIQERVGDLSVEDTEKWFAGSIPILVHNTSELFGGVSNEPANELTVFYPRSPYGVSKLFGFWIVKNYREAYKIFACNAIMFNHECLSVDTPIIIKNSKDEIDIIYVSDLIPYRTNKNADNLYLEKNLENKKLDIWDGTNWTKLKLISRKKIKTLEEKEDQKQDLYHTRHGCIRITPNHNIFTKNNIKIKAKNVNLGEELLNGEYPQKLFNNKDINTNFAKLLGMLVGDGYIGKSYLRLINGHPDIIEEFKKICNLLFCNISFKTKISKSGFNGITTTTNVSGLSMEYAKYIRNLIYHKKRKQKRIPNFILNSSIEVKKTFLSGYFCTDGLKAGKESYKYSSFKTESPLLAQGILFLINQTTKQDYNINSFIQNNKIYWQVNLLTPNKQHENFNGFSIKNRDELIKILPEQIRDNLSQHVFNIETESGKFMGGIGTLVVSNSKFRHDTFVTRKITKAVSRIKYKLQKELFLGNLDARRDWFSAHDACRGMIDILTKTVDPDDYVMASGKTTSVRDFCKLAFEYVGLNYEEYVKIDPKFFRPAEVNVLIGDYSKIKRVLGWEPTLTLKDIVKEMMDNDLKLAEIEYNNKK